MSEVDEHISKAQDKLISSKALYEINQYASSVSASYYAMFNAAKALLIKKGENPKTHNGALHLFSEVCVKNDKFDENISKYLSRTQSLREAADYDSDDGITKNIAEEKIKQAESFIEESKKFLNY